MKWWHFQFLIASPYVGTINLTNAAFEFFCLVASQRCSVLYGMGKNITTTNGPHYREWTKSVARMSFFFWSYIHTYINCGPSAPSYWTTRLEHEANTFFHSSKATGPKISEQAAETVLSDMTTTGDILSVSPIHDGNRGHP